MENLCFFGGSFFKITIADILKFQWIKYLGKGLSYLKNGDIVNYCWNYGPSKLLLYFIEYRLDQLNNKDTKTAVNLTIQFWKLLSKEIFGKGLKFFVPLTTKLRSCKILAKLNRNHLLMANIFKLHKYQAFGSLKMHNMSKIWFVYNNFSLWKTLVF